MKYFFLAVTLFIFVSCGSASTDSSLTPAQQHTQDSLAAVRVGNVSTKVFHTTGCRYVTAGLKNPINFSTRADAIAAGYTPDASGACIP